MARLLPILLVVGLLGGTAAAFAITEGLKLEKSPITRTHVVNQLFSPVCNCAKDFSEVNFRLRKGDTLTATVITPEGDPVATIANHHFRTGLVNAPLERPRLHGGLGRGRSVQAPPPPEEAPPDDHAPQHDHRQDESSADRASRASSRACSRPTATAAART